ncbi:cyanophycinase [Roseivivax sp. CAU 1753]
MSKFPSPSAFKAEGGRKLAVIGGRLEDDNDAIYAEMHRLSGGRILLFPTASSEPEAVGEESAAAFAAQGFEVEVAPLYGPNAARMAQDPALVAQIARMGSVYFTGGDQANILAALSPEPGMTTPALQAIHAMLDAGGLLAGSSAGAAMMSDPMLLGGTSLESVIHGITENPAEPGLLVGRGLGFFRFGMVDQHFIKRGRLGRMVVAMNALGVTRGYGIDENTALIVEGAAARVCGEYGVMAVDLTDAVIDPRGNTWQDFRLSYLDHGDHIDLRSGHAYPAVGKRKVLKREMAYRAPLRSRRNAFGAYTLYDVLARLVLGDTSVYCADRVEAFDARTGHNAVVLLEREKGKTRCLIDTPETGLRMTAINFRCTINRSKLSATRIADRFGRRSRTFGMAPNPEAKLIFLGSSPLNSAEEMLSAALTGLGPGPVGVLAAASSEPRATAADHVRLLKRRGIEAVDLRVTIDKVEYFASDADALERIAALNTILICGGNQSRLVETLLHRGEESAVLRAIARAHARGAALIACSGAAAALPSVMIAGGSTYDALRYGVSSDVGHQGLAIQEGVGLFAGGIVDQNLLSGRRLGRLIIACAEESERFGIGVMEDSAVTATHAGTRLTAQGRHGCVIVEINPDMLELQSDHFIAHDIQLTLLGPGDAIDLETRAVTRVAPEADSAALLQRITRDLAKEAGAAVIGDTAGVRGVKIRAEDKASSELRIDMDCPRDENA